jgi:DNA-binding CsgD family transcriptional regulator
MHGRREEAASALAQLEAYANSAAPSALTAQVLHRAGITTVELRDTAQRADRFFLKAAKMAESLGRYYTSSAAFGGLTTCAIVYDDDMPLALNFAEKAVDAAQKAGDRHSLQRALMHAVCAAVWLGDADKIADLHRRYLEVRTADSPEYAYAIPVFALVLAWQGRFAEARRKMNELNGHDPARDYDRCFACATNAVFAAVCGERETAIDLAERAFQESFLVRALQRHESIVLDNTRSISALALAVVGRGARANAMLKHAAKCDEPAAREVRDCVAAALRALDDGVMSVELRTGLERLEPVGRRGLAMLIETALATILEDSQRHGDLTEAELRVLAALAEGSSSKEIAARSGRSVHTVRTLAQRAIEKLGCSGRHQAIAIARRRGLLPVDDPSIRWG